MQVTLKLYAFLTDYLPADARRSNTLALEIPDESTVSSLIAARALPPRLVHLVLLNGQFVPPGQRDARRLCAGDVLAIWPPIAGG
ncbi:MoaD/ThiS family protein [Accumulibacter sp.]|uniref:sulfur carrier protein ThiS n=1 Tax=Accumulibacter sp. TaxID=2053492 RepID=UPI001D41E0D8|nr:MoaD/ThiS family protein [Accumulibacter sp.]MCB1933229.1 MoaD/ThiS family protein [Accumulibacter sp.]MCB1965782.1 MoaD/ThiS family protein [Accumulibacter sp.]MCP5229484.1 MoaD/ThiS family protein [Accumulibacter sp.]